MYQITAHRCLRKHNWTKHLWNFIYISLHSTFSEISCIHNENHNIINKSRIYKSQISFHEIYCFGFSQDEISFENKNRLKIPILWFILVKKDICNFFKINTLFFVKKNLGLLFKKGWVKFLLLRIQMLFYISFGPLGEDQATHFRCKEVTA